jgi:hypothetical protein
MSNEQVITLAIHKIREGLTLLADACHIEENVGSEVSCFFKRNGDGMNFDSIVIRQTDKLCRRKLPRLEINGKERKK